MKIDIIKCVESRNIKNGSCVYYGGSTVSNVSLVSLNTYVINKPTIESIRSKYQDRFDNPSYYYGGTGSVVVPPVDLTGLTVDGGSYTG